MVAEVLGRYHIEERIGAGGMGVVYRARDERLDREVAIKVLPAGAAMADDKARKRFRKEALTLSRLNHPNIGTIHDFETENGTDYLISELIRGVSLQAKLQAGPLPPSEAMRLAMQVARGLQAAHQEGIVHCDLKPGNLLIGRGGHVKIIDFGLARLQPRVEPLASTATESLIEPTTSGTMPYMAPEQLRGQEVDARTDIYALGVVLFEMVTGQRPFPQAQSLQLISAILEEAPPAPSALNPKVPPGLENIILKALDKNPDYRYQSVTEMLVDLERLSLPTPVYRPPRGLWQKLPPRTRRAAVSFLTVAAVVIVVFWIAGSRPALSFAARDWLLVADFDNQTGETMLDRSLFTAFTVSLEQSRHANIYPRSRTDEALRRMGKEAGVRIDDRIGREICLRENIRGLVSCAVSKVGSQYALSARLVDPRGGNSVRSYMETARDQEHILEALSRIAMDIRRDLGESLASMEKNGRGLPQVTTPSLQALKLYADGIYIWKKGQWRDAMGLFQQAVSIDPDFAMAHAALGGAFYSHIYNDTENGKLHMEKALALANRTSERERMIIQAQYASNLKHWDDAVRLFRVYLAAYPDDAIVRYNLATTLRDARQYAEAVEQFKEVIRIAPSDGNAYINLATTFSLMGNTPEALKWYDEAFRVEPKWVTQGNLNHEYGFTLIEGGEEAKGVEVFKQALAAPGMKGQALRSLALFDMYHGRYNDATAKLGEAIEFNRVNKAWLSEARNRFYLAQVRMMQGNRAETVRELDRAFQAVKQAGTQPNFAGRIAVGYVRNGAVEKAAAILKSIGPRIDLKNPVESVELHRLEAEVLLARGEAARAIQVLKDAEAEVPNPLVQASLARACELAGRSDEAVAAWERLLENPNRTMGWEPGQDWLAAHYQVAKLSAAAGDTTKAKRRLGELLALWKDADPDLTLAREARKLETELKK